MCRYNGMRLCCTLLQMLRRYWAAYPEERADAPEETAERIMVFQRGAEVVSVVCGGGTPGGTVCCTVEARRRAQLSAFQWGVFQHGAELASAVCSRAAIWGLGLQCHGKGSGRFCNVSCHYSHPLATPWLPPARPPCLIMQPDCMLRCFTAPPPAGHHAGQLLPAESQPHHQVQLVERSPGWDDSLVW